MFFKDAGLTDCEALCIFEVGFVLTLSFSVEAISKAKKGYYIFHKTHNVQLIYELRSQDLRPEEWECPDMYATSSECPNDILLNRLLLQPYFERCRV